MHLNIGLLVFVTQPSLPLSTALHFQNRKLEMQMFPWNVFLANRGAWPITASLPTPPRTYRRCKRGYSRCDCDSESGDFGKSRPGAFKYRWGRCRIPTAAYNCTKRRRSLSKGDDEEVFWLAGPKSDTISEGFGSCYRRGRDWRCWPFVNCSITVSQPMKQSHSEARKGFKSLDFPIISDSSHNPFYTAPLLHVSSQTPGNIHYEKPTVTYILWVVYLPQLWGTSRVSGSALQSQGKPATFTSSSIWRTILFPNAPKGKDDH